MKINVRTMHDKTLTLQVNPSDTCQQVKQLVREHDPSLSPDAHRLIYQGRILADDDTLQAASLCDEHTLLIVPAAPGQPTRGQPQSQAQGSARSISRPYNRPHLPLAPQLASLLGGAQPYGLQLPRSFAEAHPGRRVALRDEEYGALQYADFPELDVREGDNMDLLVGVGIGFMLGCVAGLCLIEASLSRRLKLGVLLGITCNVSFALLRLSMMAFKEQAADRMPGL